MSYATKCVCDGCGAVKGEGNKWLLGYEFVLWLHERAKPPFFGVRPWDDAAARGQGVLHLCTAACMQTKLAAFLESQASETVVENSVSEGYEFCGPKCLGGAAHYARAEDGARCKDGAQ